MQIVYNGALLAADRTLPLCWICVCASVRSPSAMSTNWLQDQDMQEWRVQQPLDTSQCDSLQQHTMPLLWANTSDAVLADISLSSPRKLFVFTIKKNIYRIKVPKKVKI